MSDFECRWWCRLSKMKNFMHNSAHWVEWFSIIFEVLFKFFIWLPHMTVCANSSTGAVAGIKSNIITPYHNADWWNSSGTATSTLGWVDLALFFEVLFKKIVWLPLYAVCANSSHWFSNYNKKQCNNTLSMQIDETLG